MTTQRVALVTGGGSGIGRASATALAAKGWSVVVAGRRKERLDEVVAEIAAGNLPGAAAHGSGRPTAVAVPADVRDPESVGALFDEITRRFGRLDLLFNNAGSGAPAIPIEELSYDVWQKVVGVNLTGAFLCAQGAMRLMKAQDPRGGRIINNGSISAHTPRPNSAPYTATKHAITGLTKSIALDGRPFDITCGQIDVGNASTPMTSRMREGVPQPDGSVRAEPTMDVSHVANAVVYMAELPLDANVLFMTVMATGMPFVGRG